MQAELIPNQAEQGLHRLVLHASEAGKAANAAPLQDAAAVVQSAVANGRLLGSGALRGPLQVEAGSWRLSLGQLADFRDTLAGLELELARLISSHPQTHVAAAALGIASHWPLQPTPAAPPDHDGPGDPGQGLVVHRGTLRSGDQLQIKGTVLVLGDVNPGARVSATGHVLVWGRLRGTAHAGCSGDTAARIVALQLRPLQLRIAEMVARGPDGAPPAGLAEEAKIVEGAIQIDPAQPGWPLSG